MRRSQSAIRYAGLSLSILSFFILTCFLTQVSPVLGFLVPFFRNSVNVSPSFAVESCVLARDGGREEPRGCEKKEMLVAAIFCAPAFVGYPMSVLLFFTASCPSFSRYLYWRNEGKALAVGLQRKETNKPTAFPPRSRRFSLRLPDHLKLLIRLFYLRR